MQYARFFVVEQTEIEFAPDFDEMFPLLVFKNATIVVDYPVEVFYLFIVGPDGGTF